jgi:VWFA-related protein
VLASRAACAALVAAAVGGPHGSAHGQSQAPPVFKSAVELVAVDVRVTDRSGRPVGDLTPDDFSVTIDGKPRRVVSADFMTAREAPAGSTVPGLPPEAVYSSNTDEVPAGTDGRLIALLVDQGSFEGPANRAAIAAAQRFLDRLGPADRVSLAAFPGPGPRVAFTTNHAVVRAALDRIVGAAERWPVIDPTVSMTEAIAIARGDVNTLAAVVDRECSGRGRGVTLELCRQKIVEQQAPLGVAHLRRRAAMSAYGLAGVLESLGNIDGPKTGILISGGIISGERIGDLDTDALVRSVGRSAAASRVSLYVLHLDSSFLDSLSAEHGQRPVASFADSHMLRSGLEILSGSSGGSMQTVVAGADAAFDRVAREISAAYVLGVEPAAGDSDGKAHRIQVRVRRPNTDVRGRTELIAPITPAAPPSDAQKLAAVLTSPGLARALPIRLAHVSLRESDGRMRVILSADIGRGVSGAGEVKVGYIVLDAIGRQVGYAVEQKRLAPAGQGADAAWSFVDAVAVPAGDYTVKFAALDPAGRLGSVTHAVDARAAAGDGLSVSDMLLVDPARRAASGGLAPTADGRVTGMSVGVYVEVYPGATPGVPAVTLTVSDRLDGPVLTSMSLKAVPHDDGRRVTAEGMLDLSMLPPGTFVASAIVRDGARQFARVSRPFRLDPAAGAAALAAGPRTAFGLAAGGTVVRQFSRDDALRADALDYFLNRLREADAGAAAEPAATAASAVKAGQFDAALTLLREAGPGQLSASFLTGLALFAKGDLETAAARFREALQTSNDFLPAVFYLGACYAAGGRDREAAGAWQTSLVTESDARIIFDVLADAWLRLRNGSGALAILTEARERWPDDDTFVPRMAAAHGLLQQTGRAVELLAPYLERHPADADALALGVRLLFDAHAAGRVAVSPERDRELAAAWAGLYKAAGGPEPALLDRWAAFVQKSRAGR